MNINIPDDYMSGETAAQYNKMFIETRQAGVDIGFSEKFLDDLMQDIQNENDWSFVIKAYALMETALGHLLTEKLHVLGTSVGEKKEAIEDFVSRLPMSGRTGKIKLAESLGLTQKKFSSFVSLLGEIRNFYAHSIKNVDTKVVDFIFIKNKERENEFYKAFFPGYPDNDVLGKKLPQKGVCLYIFLGICLHLKILHFSAKARTSPLSLLD
jgi:hypothetical protein